MTTDMFISGATISRQRSELRVHAGKPERENAGQEHLRLILGTCSGAASCVLVGIAPPPDGTYAVGGSRIPKP